MYDLKKFYNNLQKAWICRGFENARQFSLSTKGENGKPFITEQSISAWSKGVIPDIEKIVYCCNALDVDIDYLLGSQIYTHKIESDVHAATGLSEGAIKMLEYASNIPEATSVLSWLLEHDLIVLCGVIYGDSHDDTKESDSFHVIDGIDNGNIRLRPISYPDKNNKIRYFIYSDTFLDLIKQYEKEVKERK